MCGLVLPGLHGMSSGKEMIEFKIEEHKVLQQLNTVTIARKEVELVSWAWPGGDGRGLWGWACDVQDCMTEGCYFLKHVLPDTFLKFPKF